MKRAACCVLVVLGCAVDPWSPDVAPPEELLYKAWTPTFTMGQLITPLVPSVRGGMVGAYAASPPLPAGLSVDQETGVISGAPMVYQPPTFHTLMALNGGGTSTYDMRITIKGSPAASLEQAIAAGGSHTCAITEGAVLCWGWNQYGQLGNGSKGDNLLPVGVSGLTSGVQAITAGDRHTCALVDGGVWCWGANFSGQLGTGSTVESAAPVQVSGLASGVRAISAGLMHTCALVEDGVMCWGSNEHGQLGSGATEDSLVPVKVANLGASATAIAAGNEHTCALAGDDGRVLCWGSNSHGQLGNGSSGDSLTPTSVDLPHKAIAIAAGGSHTCASGGGVYCWGNNHSGQLGSPTNPISRLPVQVQGGLIAENVSAGAAHTCAVSNTSPARSTMYCWGANSNGALGNESTQDSIAPVRALSVEDSRISSFDLGARHSCAVSGGVVRCWGDNYSGQLGTIDSSDSTRPVRPAPWTH